MRYILLFIIALASLLAACVDNSPAGRLADALAAREMGDTAECLSACDDLMLDSAAFNQLSPSQLCTLAEIFTSLETDAETADAQATRCIHRARTLNPDSVAEFLRTCPTDISMHLYTLMSVGASLDMPRDSLLRDDDFYHDSIPQ